MEQEYKPCVFFVLRKRDMSDNFKNQICLRLLKYGYYSFNMQHCRGQYIIIYRNLIIIMVKLIKKYISGRILLRDRVVISHYIMQRKREAVVYERKN